MLCLQYPVALQRPPRLWRGRGRDGGNHTTLIGSIFLLRRTLACFIVGLDVGSMSDVPRLSDLPSRSDSELIEAVKARQPTALSVLYDRYAGLVYGLALKIMANATDAEDLTQEVFVTLWRKPSYDVRRGSLSSFLCVLTRSRAIDRLRSKGSQQRFLERWQPILSADTPTPAPFEQVSIEERRQVVQEALSQLPENQRQILELLYYQGLSQAEVSRQLGIPLGTVKTRSRQALFKLRSSLQPLLH
ncbi:sigma-70 family RNA polymerase sigma factor [Synechococcus sp. Nb3U1]|nr:sigma-70 family RNA polymerase sigma factor [Synechococcus sp. Nb3U1]